jgi:peroxiredoxin
MIMKALKTLVLTSTLVLLPAAQIPRQAPDLPIKLPNGQVLKLSQYRGKVVALEFLLTTCSHCQRASQVLNKLQKELGNKGFQALGVAINPMANMLVPDYVKEFQLEFPVGSDTHETANDFLQHSVMFRMLMPQLVLIDRDGVIRAQYAGDDPFFKAGEDEKNLRAKLEELVNSPVKKSSTPASTSASKPASKKS